ncbi:MAG: hypothetical protein Q9174_003942, partial [Haloplaca sp. 1 TL-2023]
MAATYDSDHVVEAYKESLSDLVHNNKHEINTLTMIANESILHAQGIVRVLENHIRNVPPERKLPALYVLDSIAKNVAGPYTRILSNNLFKTFMGAYSLVAPQIRKKLDEMVKTWKEPVPGSIDPKPVFSPDTTRPIETALIKYRTLAFQSAQHDPRQQRPSGAVHPMMNVGYSNPTPQPHWQDTATPPHNNGYYPPSNAQAYPYPNGYPQAPYQPPNPYASQPPPNQDLTSLHRDIEDLISITKIEFADRHWDIQVQQKLKALLDLQSIMSSQQLPPHDFQAVRDQVTQLAQTSQQSRPAHSLPPASLPLPNPVPTPTPSVFPAHPPPTTQSGADSTLLISSNALAEILASAARAKQNTPTPSLPSSAPPPQYPPHVPTTQAPPNSSTAPSMSTTSLFENLRAFGMLGPSTGATAPSSYPQQSNRVTRVPLTEIRNDVVLSSASLKIPRPHLIREKLFDARPNQCSTCGQRFLATEEGKQKKARHLDSHFRSNQRLADSARRIQSRSWYLDELEWIKLREGLDEDPAAMNGGEDAKARAAAEAAKNDPKNKYIPVPDDITLRSAPCPICQDKFEQSFDNEKQDWLWRDAIQIGPRVYHASCYSEMKKDGANTPMRTATPDS